MLICGRKSVKNNLNIKINNFFKLLTKLKINFYLIKFINYYNLIYNYII